MLTRWAGQVAKGVREALPRNLPGSFDALSNMTLRTHDPQSSAFAVAPDAINPHSKDHKQSWLSRQTLRVRLAILIPFLSFCVGLSAFAGLMVYYTMAFPHPLSIRADERAPVIRILARDGSVIAERGSAHDYMPLEFLPRHVQAAVVATEDRRFFDHSGLDPVGLARAFFANLRAGRFIQGGSTLTQQLAKNLFLSSDRTLSRKTEELALAFWLELRLSKADILELYLNRVYFGAGAYGIEAASQRYFDKSARELTIAEGALIAGLLKAPSRYSPASSPDLARARGRVVLNKMLDAGYISSPELRKALAQRVVFVEPKASRDQSGADYAIDFVLDRMPQFIGDDHSEIVVETTLDASLQRHAYEVVRDTLDRVGAKYGASQAAVIVLDNDGGIRAMVGGRDYTKSQFNRAVKARRQPGSAFKPVVYLAALEAGMTPDSVAHDLPISLEGWAPRNDNGQYIGAVALRDALAKSINTVAVQLHQLVGRGRTVSVARRLGITAELRDDPSLALGTSEVTLIEMASAYAVFANGGDEVMPHVVRRVRSGSGRVLYAREILRPRTIVEPQVAGAMNDMLNAALVSGTGRRAAIPNHPAAGKTGTTQDHRDAWFVGYTSHLTAGVWIGNDDGRPMKHATGGGVPADIWRQIMVEAHSGRAPLRLPGTVPLQAPSDAMARAIPRAGQDVERLPWLQPQATPAPPTPAPAATLAPRPAAAPAASARIVVTPTQRVVNGVVSKKPAPQAARQASHPQNQINEDFINQALDGLEANGDTAAVADGSVPSAPPEAVAARPSGLMSLGGWW